MDLFQEEIEQTAIERIQKFAKIAQNMTTRKKKKTCRSNPTFGYVDYSLSFDFLDNKEKKHLYSCLKEAWEWAYPPEIHVEDREDIFK